MTNRLLSLIISTIFSTALLWGIPVENVENVHLENRNRYVTDGAAVFTPQGLAQADSILSSVWSATSAEPVVVVVDNLDGRDINDYATDLFTRWGIGKDDKDNGLLVLVSVGDRRAAIRTGYGVEGVIPDAIAAGIIRNDMAPRFRQGDYEGGIIAAVSTISSLLSDPQARDEIMSRYANNSKASASQTDFFSVYLTVCLLLAVAMLVWVVATWFASRRQPTAQAYHRLQAIRLPCLVATVLALGIPVLAYLLLVVMMRHVRLHKRLCPHCSAVMQRVDEDNDNNYLTQAQDAEERLDSVDYDVWLCPSCGETDIIPYVNPKKNYTVCSGCGARACTLVNHRTLVPPSTARDGVGVDEYQCLNCHQRTERRFSIPKVVAPPVIITGGGRGFGGGGGGFSGGSFGGGMTGGGGASGGW
ncbi:MAG: TPM domain-containing protein [Muribaculaceae bacterium]|nr:TPM domain-containing protein [Muribaculaceae bacterium]